MNRNEFINTLKIQLARLPKSEVEDILYDYEEHFNIGKEDGREESEIAMSLGDPKMIAKELQANYRITVAKTDGSVDNVFRAVFATLGLGFFNLVFVFGPFVGVAAVIFSLFVSGIAIMISGVMIIVGGFLVNYFPNYISLPDDIWINIFIGIGMFSLGMTFVLVMHNIGKLFLRVTIQYLNFNLNMIMNRRNKNENIL